MGLDNEELKGRCETCGGLPKGNHGRLALDHDHSVIGAKHGSVEERLWRHVERRGEDECWPWTGSTNPWGYGQMTVPAGWMGNGYKRPWPVHRVVWAVTRGRVPEGQVDHTCHNDSDCPGGICEHRRCCNHAHLENVTADENKRRGKSLNAINARKTRCNAGHEFTPENTRVRPSGSRSCRICDREAAARSNAAKRERL